MPACSRIDERAPSAPTKSRAEISLPSASVDVDRLCGIRKSLNRGGTQIDTERPGFRNKRVDQQSVLDHVRERLALLHLAAEGEEGRPHRVFELAVGHHHVEHGLRFVRDRVPDFDGFEQPARGGGDGGGARVLRLRSAKRRIGDRY